MHVVAALHRQRHPVTQRAENNIRPGPERHDGVATGERAFGRLDAPAVGVSLKRAGVAGKKDAAARGEKIRIGFRERAGIDDGGGVAEMQAAGDRRKGRLQRRDPRRIERIDGEAEGAHAIRLRRADIKAARMAENLQPAVMAHESFGACGGDQRRVFGKTVLDERPERRETVRGAFRAAAEIIFDQPGADRRQG